MDDPGCDQTKLHATYRRFDRINRLVAGWRRIYRRYLRPRLQARGAATLVDIGAGGCDVILRLRQWALRDKLSLSVTALDPDPRVAEYLKLHPLPSDVRFLPVKPGALLRAGERFDFVISNHLLHHLHDAEIPRLCSESSALARHLVLHNDIARNPVAYQVFRLTRPFFRGSFITEDGLTSIRRSFTASELSALAPKGWRVTRMAPYRTLLIFEAAGDGGQ